MRTEPKSLILITSDVLIPKGFKKRGQYWYRQYPEVTEVINIQKSKYSSSCYVNIGVCLNVLMGSKRFPLINDFDIISRIGRFFPESPHQPYLPITEFPLEFQDQASIEHYRNVLDVGVERAFSFGHSARDLKAAISNGAFDIALIHLRLRQHLAAMPAQ